MHMARFKGRFLYLLISLLSLFVVHPFFQGRPIGIIVLDVLVLFVLATGIYIAAQKRALLIAALVLAAPMFGARWASYFLVDPVLLGVGYGFGMAFFLFTAVIILAYIVRQQRVTADTIYGALCGYLLIGLSWALAFSSIELFESGSFVMTRVDGVSAANLLPDFL